MSNKFLIKQRTLFVLLLTIFLIAAYLYQQNNHVSISRFIHQTSKIKKKIRVVQVSDFHSKEFGNEGKKLGDLVKGQQPDLIVITGDLVDQKDQSTQTAIHLIQGMKGKVPILYVPGNHEAQSSLYTTLKDQLREEGVVVLEDQRHFLNINNQEFFVVGLKDPVFYDTEMEKVLKTEMDDIHEGNFSALVVLLSHRPEKMELYSRYGADIVFSGHAHGGQIRLPLAGGLIAPHQGFFPDYSEGIYQEKDTVMFVSRGLGNSIFPWRINNRPDLVVVDIVPKEG